MLFRALPQQLVFTTISTRKNYTPRIFSCPRGPVAVRTVVSTLLPVPIVSLVSWFFGLLFVVGACFQLCSEVKDQLKLL